MRRRRGGLLEGYKNDKNSEKLGRSIQRHDAKSWAKSWAKNWAMNLAIKSGTPTPEGRRIRQRRIPPARPSTGRTIGRASERISRQHLEASFFEAWGSFWEPFGIILGALGGHLGGLWGHLATFWAVWTYTMSFLPLGANTPASF